MNKTMCFVAGKSGGHSIPCLTMARAAKRSGAAARVVFITTTTRLDQHIVAQYPEIDSTVGLVLQGNPGKRIWLYPVFFGRLFGSLVTSWRVLRHERPDCVVSTGGLIAVPVVLAARVLGISVQLWELNVDPGKTVKYLAPIADHLIVCFEQTKKHLKWSQVRSYPVRFTPEDKLHDRAQVLRALGLDPERFTIFVLGGSQGSVSLNSAIIQALEQQPELVQQVQVIHQTGAENVADVTNNYARLQVPAHVFAYAHELAPIFVASNLVVSRAGAGAMAEIAFFQMPAIIVPLPNVAGDHQMRNARAWERKNPQLTVIDQKDAAFVQMLARAIALAVSTKAQR